MLDRKFAYWLANELGSIAPREYNIGNVGSAQLHILDAKTVYESCGLTRPDNFEQ